MAIKKTDPFTNYEEEYNSPEEHMLTLQIEKERMYLSWPHDQEYRELTLELSQSSPVIYHQLVNFMNDGLKKIMDLDVVEAFDNSQDQEATLNDLERQLRIINFNITMGLDIFSRASVILRNINRTIGSLDHYEAQQSNSATKQVITELLKHLDSLKVDLDKVFTDDHLSKAEKRNRILRKLDGIGTRMSNCNKKYRDVVVRTKKQVGDLTRHSMFSSDPKKETQEPTSTPNKNRKM